MDRAESPGIGERQRGIDAACRRKCHVKVTYPLEIETAIVTEPRMLSGSPLLKAPTLEPIVVETLPEVLDVSARPLESRYSG